MDFQSLPVEIKYNILNNLSIHDLVNVFKTDKEMFQFYPLFKNKIDKYKGQVRNLFAALPEYLRLFSFSLVLINDKISMTEGFNLSVEHYIDEKIEKHGHYNGLIISTPEDFLTIIVRETNRYKRMYCKINNIIYNGVVIIHYLGRSVQLNCSISYADIMYAIINIYKRYKGDEITDYIRYVQNFGEFLILKELAKMLDSTQPSVVFDNDLIPHIYL